DRIDDRLLAAAQRSRDLARLALRSADLHRRLANWLHRLDGVPGKPAAQETQDAANGANTEHGANGANDAVPEVEVEEFDEAVLWSEVHQSGVTLHATPLSVAPAMRRHREL